MSKNTPLLSESVLDAIGHTPLVSLNRIVGSAGLEGKIYAKLEYLNPGFSMKDRIAVEMLQQARERGDLQPGQTVVELTSGNTGTGLAIVCKAMGHPFVAVMSRGNTMERARQMHAFGAEVELVDQAEGSTPGQVSGEDIVMVEQRTAEVEKELGAYRANQFELQSNCDAHEKTTGQEIWEQSKGEVDVFVAFPGTAGTFTGIMRALKKHKSQVRGYVIEPEGAAAVAGHQITKPSHKIQGGGYAMMPTLMDTELIHDYLQVTDEQAIAGARLLAREEGIFGGFSTGAHLAAAMELLKERERGAKIAFLVCDSGLKYLSTDLYPAAE